MCAPFQVDRVQERECLSRSYLGEKECARMGGGAKEGHEPSDIVDSDVTISGKALILGKT